MKKLSRAFDKIGVVHPQRDVYIARDRSGWLIATTMAMDVSCENCGKRFVVIIVLALVLGQPLGVVG